MKACKRATEGCPNLVRECSATGYCAECRADEMLLYLGDLVMVFRQAAENSGALGVAMTPMLMALREQLDLGEGEDPRVE